MNLKLLPLSRSSTKSEESGGESATKSNRRYLWATIGLAAVTFLGRRWSSGDDDSSTVESSPSKRGSGGGRLSRRMKAMIVGTAVLALVRIVRRRRTRTSVR
jgi:hypothetical protein